MGYGLGSAVRRKEDSRLLRGEGLYTGDLVLPGQLHAAFVRSPHASAMITHIDIGLSQGMPGVHAVITGDDLTRDGVGRLYCDAEFRSRDGSQMNSPLREPLPTERVRFVGECIALVVADSPTAARDAADAVVVEYEVTPPIVDIGRALGPGAPLVWPEYGTNLVVNWEHGDRDAVNTKLSSSAKRVTARLVNNRLAANPMEPRVAISDFDASQQVATLYAPTQGGRRIQGILARVLNLPLNHVRVVSHDTGGGFGIRSKTYPELVVIVYAAMKLGRPVKWQGDRSETFLSDYHGRDQVNLAEIGFDESGRMTSMKLETLLNVGAYLSENGVRIPIDSGGRIIPCHYHVPDFYMSVKPCFTNTICTDTYRGAGRPEANYVMERLMDMAAEAFGVSRAEIRRRNFISPDMMPYRTHLGYVIDSGEFETLMNRAMQEAQWTDFGKRKAESAARGRLRGIGLATFIEGAGSRPIESMRVRIDADGGATIYAGTYSHGQGHATVYAQLVHEFLGVNFDSVHLVQGDTNLMPEVAHGSFGSRSSMVGGAGLKHACDEIIEKGKSIAAQLLQCSGSEVSFSEGVFSAGLRSVRLRDVAAASLDADKSAADGPVGLDITHVFSSDTENFPNGAHVCEVEIDPETGILDIVSYVAVDDCGVVMNPLIVDGQICGGVAQGLGQALMEHVVYDESGQLITGSFMDYAMPRAGDMPQLKTILMGPPSRTNVLGVKGAGEAGTCGAPPAIVSAASHALKPLGVRHVDMPLTPERLWRAIHAARHTRLQSESEHNPSSHSEEEEHRTEEPTYGGS